MILHRSSDVHVTFHCPGCKCGHTIAIAGTPAWEWNNDMEAPTFMPSIRVSSGHHVPDFKGDACWCTYNAEHKDNPAPFECGLCHSYVNDGMIQFLADCTHELRGQTVRLPEWES